MAERFEEYKDFDSLKRLEIESAEINITSDAYVSVTIPLNETKTVTGQLVSRTILDRYPERVVIIKNTHASNPLKYQVEWTGDKTPNNGDNTQWAAISGKKDMDLSVVDYMDIESSSRVPYTGMRVRVKRGTTGLDGKCILILCFSKWMG